MGCSDSKSVSISQEKRPKSDTGSNESSPKSVAFEVKLDGEEEATSNGEKPQLPRRLQERLEEENHHTTHTMEQIEEKIQKATERRLQAMEERLFKARRPSITLDPGRAVSRAQEGHGSQEATRN